MFVKYGVSCVPINGFEIAQKMGVKIISYSAISESKRWLLIKKSEDGFSVEKTDGQWYIFYNDEKDYGCVNHTIMHEIGHIVLDHSEDSELAEKEVKFFAKYALAPTRKVSDKVLAICFSSDTGFFNLCRYEFMATAGECCKKQMVRSLLAKQRINRHSYNQLEYTKQL